jgi:hypothetical protein
VLLYEKDLLREPLACSGMKYHLRGEDEGNESG